MSTQAARSTDDRQGRRSGAGSADRGVQDAAGRGGAVLADVATGDRPELERGTGRAPGLRASREVGGRRARERAQRREEEAPEGHVRRDRGDDTARPHGDVRAATGEEAAGLETGLTGVPNPVR